MLSLLWHRMIAAGAGALDAKADCNACTIVKPATSHLAPLIAAAMCCPDAGLLPHTSYSIADVKLR